MCLSKGGKVTLLKSTLSNLPTYFLSLLPIPADVALRIEITVSFYLDVIKGESKFNLVNWNKLCLSYQNGGLAIGKIRLFNEVLEVWLRKGSFMETCDRSEVCLNGGWLVHEGCSGGLWSESLEIHTT